jgi:glutaredoxin-like protein
MGLLVERRELGFGRRSRRYSMYVEDGTIRKAFVEPDGPGDPFEVSDADTMYAHLVPDAPRRPHVAIVTKPGCPYCTRAKERLRESGVPFVELALEDAIRGRALGAMTGATTAPQVFVDGRLVGGSEQLEQWLRTRPAAPAH